MTRDEIINTLLVLADARETLASVSHGSILAKEATALREAAEMLKAAPAWVSVEDRLPEVDQPVIVCREVRKGECVVEQGQRDVKDWWKVYGRRTKRVTHWMSLPKPPKGEQNEQHQ